MKWLVAGAPKAVTADSVDARMNVCRHRRVLPVAEQPKPRKARATA